MKHFFTLCVVCLGGFFEAVWEEHTCDVVFFVMFDS